MDPIQHEVTPATLSAASYEHFIAYEQYCARVPDGEIVDLPELAWGISGVLSPYMNSVVRTRLKPGADVDTVIESVLDRARERAVPMGWFLLPGSAPADIGTKLIVHGFAYEGDDPGMSVDLRLLPEHVPAPAGLKIVEVLDLPTLEQWATAWGESYNAPDNKRQNRFEFRRGQGLGPGTPYRSYLAYLDGQPVATSELFLGAGVAAVVWVGTVPAARGQGIGAAITLAPLHEAIRLGYRIGSLTASPMGFPVYQRLGFQEYCRLPVYVWRPPE